MLKFSLRYMVVVALVISMVGCANNNNQGSEFDRTDSGIQQQQQSPNTRLGVASRGWDNSRNNNYTPLHNNSKMEISNEIADAISAMNEVDTATVLITNQNAYVAVILDNGTGYGSTSMGRNVGKVNTRKSDIDRISNAAGDDATTDGMGRRGSGVGERGLTEGLKEAIAQKVRAVQPDLNHVYVSANPDFVGRMRGYGEKFQNGQPIRGMIIEFNTMVRRLFPTAE